MNITRIFRIIILLFVMQNNSVVYGINRREKTPYRQRVGFCERALLLYPR
jgi:hypothetical protein